MARKTNLADGDLPDAALHVLLALTVPRHGYAVMQFLEEQSGGTVQMGPASLYTTLKKLVVAELIDELPGDDSRRTYRLTPTGREALARSVDRRRQLLAMADRILENR